MRLKWVVLLSAVLGSLSAQAEEKADADALKTTVEQNLLRPLVRRENERSQFSRAALPPLERRVRILDSALKEDAQGQHFAAFAIDSRWPGSDKWSTDGIAGCVYPKDGSIYVQRGKTYKAAAILLGKKTENPPETVCRAKSGDAQTKS